MVEENVSSTTRVDGLIMDMWYVLCRIASQPADNTRPIAFVCFTELNDKIDYECIVVSDRVGVRGNIRAKCLATKANVVDGKAM